MGMLGGVVCICTGSSTGTGITGAISLSLICTSKIMSGPAALKLYFDSFRMSKRDISEDRHGRGSVWSFDRDRALGSQQLVLDLQQKEPVFTGRAVRF